MSVKMTPKKKLFFQSALVFLIALAVTGTWLIKNGANSETQITNGTPLEIQKIDLQTIQSAKLPAIIDFGSDSCAPCLAMAPALRKMNAEMQGKALVHYLDVGLYAEAAMDYPIRVTPTQIFYSANGKPYIPGKDLQNRLSFIYYESKSTGEHLFTVHEGGLTEDDMRAILADMGVSS